MHPVGSSGPHQAAAEYRAVQCSGTELVTRHADLVRRIAHQLAARLPACVEVDDLIQAGMIGLLDAARSYDAEQGASFETYASIRIRGAMIDDVRRSDWAPRSVHRRSREIAATIREIEQRTGRSASAQEVADKLGLPLAEYQRALEDAARSQVLSLDTHVEEHGDVQVLPRGGPTPGQVFDRGEFGRELSAAIAGLPEREQLVLSLYYEKDLNLKEIGAVLGVSESRVCQIHGQAVIRLRGRLSVFESVDAGLGDAG